jgi:hypothetical protein
MYLTMRVVNNRSHEFRERHLLRDCWIHDMAADAICGASRRGCTGPMGLFDCTIPLL